MKPTCANAGSRQSSIPWFPELPKEWAAVRIRSLFEWRRERNNPVKSQERLSLSIDKGVTLYSEKTTNLDRFKETFTEYLLAYPNDIVLNSMNMIVGAVGKSRYFGCVSPAYYVICLKDTQADVDYYAKLLNIQALRDMYHVLGRGICAIERGDGRVNTCRLKVPFNGFASIVVPKPPLPEQRAIVAFLDEKCEKVDSLVVAKQKTVELLKELRERVISDAVTKGVGGGKTCRASDNPWLPEVPEGWEVHPLRHFLTPVSRKGFPEKQLLSVTREQGVIVRDRESKEENHNFIPEDLSNYKLVEKDDFAVNKMKAWQGSYGVSSHEGIVSPAYFVYKLQGVDGSFFSMAIRSKAYIPFFARFSKGIRVGQWDLSPIAVRDIPFLLPPLDEQRRIVAHIEAKTAKIDALVEKLGEEIEKLKEYRERLVAAVVTGERQVVKVEA